MARSRCRVGWWEFSAPVVQVLRLAMLNRSQHATSRRLVAAQLVGDQHPGHVLQALESLRKASSGAASRCESGLGRRQGSLVADSRRRERSWSSKRSDVTQARESGTKEEPGPWFMGEGHERHLGSWSGCRGTSHRRHPTARSCATQGIRRMTVDETCNTSEPSSD